MSLNPARPPFGLGGFRADNGTDPDHDALTLEVTGWGDFTPEDCWVDLYVCRGPATRQLDKYSLLHSMERRSDEDTVSWTWGKLPAWVDVWDGTYASPEAQRLSFLAVLRPLQGSSQGPALSHICEIED